jgi:hypothetical protein
MRRTLEGRELVERALRMCERHRCETVLHVKAMRARIQFGVCNHGHEIWDWTPWPVGALSVSLLRELKRGGVVYYCGQDLQLVGQDLVVTEVDA